MPETDAASGARDALRACAAQIATARTAVLTTDDPEGPHQLRVALRRLRAALWLYAPAIGRIPAWRMATEARWLAREVGQTRDLEMVAGLLETRLGGVAGRGAIAGLTAAAGIERARLRVLLHEARTEALLAGLAGAGVGTGGATSVPLATLAADRLDHRWQRLRHTTRHLARQSAQERHAMRKQAKKLRYVLDLTNPLWPDERNARFHTRLARLQDGLGRLNDATVARRIVQQLGATGALAANAQGMFNAALNRLDRDTATDLADLPRQWRKLARTPRPWR